MYETTANLVISMYDIMVDGGYEFDLAYCVCDLGYTGGLMYSPKHFEQQLHRTFERLFLFFHSRGIPAILHTDGRVLDLIPYFIEEGLDGLDPLEVKAGMDLVELKDKYRDKLTFSGGIDARAMAADDPEVVGQEIKTKLRAAKEGGGYFFHSDHSIPNAVSFQQYQRVLELFFKYGRY
jgi:uroporphyrinogen decarboxylase